MSNMALDGNRCPHSVVSLALFLLLGIQALILDQLGGEKIKLLLLLRGAHIP